MAAIVAVDCGPANLVSVSVDIECRAINPSLQVCYKNKNEEVRQDRCERFHRVFVPGEIDSILKWTFVRAGTDDFAVIEVYRIVRD